jgi:formate hydrogenlyase subunit 4
MWIFQHKVCLKITAFKRHSNSSVGSCHSVLFIFGVPAHQGQTFGFHIVLQIVVVVVVVVVGTGISGAFAKLRTSSVSPHGITRLAFDRF